MRRLAFKVTEDDMEQALDALLPLIPHGVHRVPGPDETVDLAAFDLTGDLPPLAQLEAAVGPRLIAASEEEAPDDPAERRLRYTRREPIGGRVSVRSSDEPAPEDPTVVDLVIDAPRGAFGAGRHPTTRMCLELLLTLPPGGPFADLGCGAGLLAVAAAKLGWRPVFAVDHEVTAIRAAAANAERNGVQFETLEADLLKFPPPPAPLLAANVPLAVHAHLAAALPSEVERVIVSGIVDHHVEDVVRGYAAAGLSIADKREGPGWVALLLQR